MAPASAPASDPHRHPHHPLSGRWQSCSRGARAGVAGRRNPAPLTPSAGRSEPMFSGRQPWTDGTQHAVVSNNDEGAGTNGLRAHDPRQETRWTDGEELRIGVSFGGRGEAAGGQRVRVIPGGP